jgi:ribonuclease J
MSKNLNIIPLGGMGEIGRNLTIYEYGSNMIVVDCGVMFPENDMYGIDLVLPDFNYILKNQEKLRGIVLTHGHMDHIGGLPYLLRDVHTPVYGTPLTLGLVRRKLEEANLLDVSDLRTLSEVEHLGPFRVKPFPVAHSIPDSVGLVIETPVGSIVHTGDYKLDETPAGGRTTDLKKLRKLTTSGVLAMLGDSTNADQPGRTPTEAVVGETLDRLFKQAKGQRIIIATFSSVLARLQEIMYLAQKHNRKVALTGRSLVENVELARELGYLKVPKDILVDIHANIPAEELVILSTGSQGEPRSALNRMANGQHRQVSIQPGDTVVISGGTIPGNEEDVGRMLNNLFERGADVIYGPIATVHVSGHGSQEDMRMMLDTVKPRFLIPAHGEARHLHLHAKLADEAGMQKEDIFILRDGARWITDGEKAWLGESIDLDDVYVDGRLVGEIGEIVMRDRHRLSKDGFVVALIPVDGKKKLAGEPQFVSRGFVYLKDSGDLLDAGRQQIKRHHDQGAAKVRRALEDFFYRETKSRPVVLPRYIQS